MKQIGKEKFLKMLKTSSEMSQLPDEDAGINYDERTLSVWSADIKKGCENWSDRLTFEVLNDSQSVFEIKTFREADASEIGSAGVCYQDDPMTKAFNPNIKLIRDKTLMQGQDCCHFKWVKDA